MPSAAISYLWRDQDAPSEFRTGVSLHSHTNQSQETLDFLANFGNQFPVMRPILSRLERRSEQVHGVPINYAAGYWTPPMTPKLAYDLERRQIEQLGLAAMVSITDHDNIRAPMLLRTVPSARQIPVSVEWSAPYGGVQSFHLGVHNLPSARAAEWMQTLADYTANPSDARLGEILNALHQMPDVLVVFNHPLWDLYIIGQQKHEFLVNEFLQKHGNCLHALELNGLRNWDENRAVRRLAERWNMLLISGGDRHGVEPNANLNLTNAGSFTEFVHEIRRERRSHLLFMPQYTEPWKLRILRSTIDAVRNYPEFPQGSRRWDERVYHPDGDGVVRPLCELWPRGTPPRAMTALIAVVQRMDAGLVSGSLRMAWNDAHQLQLALGENEA
jgi:mRNA-degrading endonuclease toxin of MazEF toxin-antitoxin module